ncbi:MAG: DUF5681 domain-containing protein [Alphaproteobacteria bacterium]
MYKKPPAHTRFKKGTSGNPAGRPKKVKANITLLEQLLETFLLAIKHDEPAKSKITRIEKILGEKD